MCGIAGIISASGKTNRNAVTAMIDSMAHRGPDGQGVWHSPDERVCLGHRRLSIIDLRAVANQPMLDPNTGAVIVFNGEIYNFIEVRDRLILHYGYHFETQSDTEVILAAWRVWGGDCFKEFNGMFAIALWDPREDALILARDRFGEKPLLYALTPDFLAFASEYKALFQLADLSSDVDWARLARFLTTPSDGLDRGDTTLFPAIAQVEAGCWIRWKPGGAPHVHRYWTPAAAPAPAPTDFASAAHHLRDLLEDSIRLRLRSDVTVGSCLSGGLDSSSIACLVRQSLGPDAPYHTFSGRFPGLSADEGDYIDSVAAQVKPLRHDVAPDPAQLLTEFGHFAWMNELPVDSASQYAQWCVFRLARAQGVTVLLDGQGADEILGGYEPYFLAHLRANPGDRAAIDQRYPGLLDSRHPGKQTFIPRPLRKAVARLFHKGSDIAFGLRPTNDTPQRPPPASLREALQVDSTDGFLGTLLRYGDRNSMAHSVEVRLPFCDHRLYEWAQSLPSDFLMGDGQTKRILREAMRGILPETIRTRWRKQGFVPPQDDWMDRGLFRAAQDIILDPGFARSTLWHSGWWEGVLRRFQSGQRTLASPLWKLLATETWRSQFLHRIAQQPKQPALSGP